MIINNRYIKAASIHRGYSNESNTLLYCGCLYLSNLYIPLNLIIKHPNFPASYLNPLYITVTLQLYIILSTFAAITLQPSLRRYLPSAFSNAATISLLLPSTNILFSYPLPAMIWINDIIIYFISVVTDCILGGSDLCGLH